MRGAPISQIALLVAAATSLALWATRGTERLNTSPQGALERHAAASAPPLELQENSPTIAPVRLPAESPKDNDDVAVAVASSPAGEDVRPSEVDTAIARILERREWLTDADRWHDADSQASVELSFANMCVIAILNAAGRADRTPDAVVGGAAGFRVKARSSGELYIVAGGARYMFLPGEFPAYDFALDRSEAAREHPNLPLPPLSPQEVHSYNQLMNNALAALGAESPR